MCTYLLPPADPPLRLYPPPPPELLLLYPPPLPPLKLERPDDELLLLSKLEELLAEFVPLSNADDLVADVAPLYCPEDEPDTASPLSTVPEIDEAETGLRWLDCTAAGWRLTVPTGRLTLVPDAAVAVVRPGADATGLPIGLDAVTSLFLTVGVVLTMLVLLEEALFTAVPLPLSPPGATLPGTSLPVEL